MDFKEYATRQAILWLTNTESYYTHFISEAEKARQEAQGNEDEAAEVLAKVISEEIKAEKPTGNGLFIDLLDGAIEEIDFYEVAKNFLDE